MCGIGVPPNKGHCVCVCSGDQAVMDIEDCLNGEKRGLERLISKLRSVASARWCVLRSESEFVLVVGIRFLFRPDMILCG